MRETNIQISRSNVIDSLMPLLLSTSIVHDGEVVKAFSLNKDTDNFKLFLQLEKEN